MQIVTSNICRQLSYKPRVLVEQYLMGFSMLRVEAGFSELKDLQKYGSVYINSAGGHTFGIEFTQFYRREELVFPNFTEDDIHIKQYGEKGIHWYAYIGDMQLHYGDKRK